MLARPDVFNNERLPQHRQLFYFSPCLVELRITSPDIRKHIRRQIQTRIKEHRIMPSEWQESEILQDILDGLNAAIADESWDHEELDPIKFNKLLYLAVDHFRLPITYRWYKYGADFTPHGLSLSEDVAPTALDELPSPDEPRIDSSDIEDNTDTPSPQQVKQFYQSEVDAIGRLFENDTKAYLESFYHDYAPEGLEDLYATCAVFQKSLDEVGHASAPKQVVDSNINTLLDELHDLSHEVMFCAQVADADEPFRNYADLLEDVLVTVADKPEGLSPRQQDTFRSVVTFFYEEAWQLAALKIAGDEATGGHAFDWRQTATQRYLQEFKQFDKDLRGLRAQVRRAGLIADNLLDFSGSPVRSADHTDRAEHEMDVYEDWEGVSQR